MYGSQPTDVSLLHQCLSRSPFLSLSLNINAYVLGWRLKRRRIWGLSGYISFANYSRTNGINWCLVLRYLSSLRSGWYLREEECSSVVYCNREPQRLPEGGGKGTQLPVTFTREALHLWKDFPPRIVLENSLTAKSGVKKSQILSTNLVCQVRKQTMRSVMSSLF